MAFPGNTRKPSGQEIHNTERLQPEQFSQPGPWYPFASSRVSEARYDKGLQQIQVIFKDGRASAFIFQSSFTSALKLFEAADLMSRLGQPTAKLPKKSFEVYLYENLRVGFLVGKGQVVTGLMCL